MVSNYAELLSQEEVRQIHEASLEILEQVGLQVKNENALRKFKGYGCRIESNTQTVRIPRKIVESLLEYVPPNFTFYARDPSFDRTIPVDSPVISSSSAAPNILDPQTGDVRRARSDDIARIAYLINELPGYDNISISVTADDAPEDQFSLSRFYPALKHCLKPVMGSAPSLEEYPSLKKLGVMIAGNEKKFRERPFMTFIYCALLSPLTLDQESTEKLLRYTEDEMPSFGVVAPTAGVSAPFTLAGTLAVANAEFLAQTVLEQIVKAGKPTIYCALPTATDIRMGDYAPGAIETGILVMGCAQMARYYKVPSGGFIGQTNAKANNAQSGFETGMSSMAALLAGFDLFFLGGLLDSLMIFDYPKAVIDNEIALMLKQTKRGLNFNSENLALDVIKDVGPGGMFMDIDHTFERMNNTALLTQIADRSPWNQWEAQGKPSPQGTAMEQVYQILSRDNPAVFSPDLDARIQAEFEDLVTSNLSWP